MVNQYPNQKPGQQQQGGQQGGQEKPVNSNRAASDLASSQGGQSAAGRPAVNRQFHVEASEAPHNRAGLRLFTAIAIDDRLEYAWPMGERSRHCRYFTVRRSA